MQHGQYESWLEVEEEWRWWAVVVDGVVEWRWMVVKTKRRDRDVVVYIAARHYAMPKGDYVVRAPPWRVTTSQRSLLTF